MVGTLQPLDEKFPIVGEDGRPTIYFIKWAQQRQIDITDAITAEEALQIVVDYIAAHPVSATWGTITGILSNQTDLETALDSKIPFDSEDAALWYVHKGIQMQAPPLLGVDGGIVYFQTSGISHGDPGATGYIYGDLSGGGWTGQVTANMRLQFGSWGAITGWEFDQDPYVNTFKIFHEGNLSFGSGLSYDTGTGVLTATASGGVLPVVDGSIPPVFLQNPDGSLIYTPI